MNHEYFKTEKQIEPILIYTSNLEYKDKNGQRGIIYSDVNKYIRTNNIFATTEEAFKQEWKYRYASDLIKHLEQIKKTPAKVYRGVDFDLGCEKGDKYTFVPFTSTSLD